MERLQYQDFEIRLSREGRRYVVHVYCSPAGEASGEFRLPFSKDKLENYILRLTRIRSARRIDSPEHEAACDLGAGLFQALFQGQVRDCFRSSLEKTRAMPETGLRIKLRLQDVPEIADLPWEFLFDRDTRRFLAQSSYTPVIRYMELPESIRPLRIELPLRILGMISSPSNYPALDVQHEKALVQEALMPLIEKGAMEVDWLEQATLAALHKKLKLENFHVFHFIGHGGIDEKREQGVLVLEDERGMGQWVEAERLGVIFNDHRTLRLAVLNACEGARNSRTDPFSGVATALVQQSVPAVVAMQFSISDGAAINFAAEFYASLAQGFPLDTAIAEARKAIYMMPNDVEWGTPVLYLRAADGILFDVQTTSGGEAKQKQEPRIEKPERIFAPTAEGQAPAPETETLAAPKEQKIEVKLPEPDLKIETQPQEPEQEATTSQIERADAQGPGAPKTEEATVKEASKSDKQTKQLKPTIKHELLYTLKGHNKQVNSIAFSPDGCLLASGSGGVFKGSGPLRLWQTADGHQLRTLEGHAESILSVAFSPDGRLLASGSYDNSVRLWQVMDGKLLCTLTQEEVKHPVKSVIFSPDGRLLASGYANGPVRLWTVVDGKLLRTLEGHTNGISNVAFSPDGRLLASGASDKSVRLWQVEDSQLLFTLKLEEHYGHVNSVAFSPDGHLLASGSLDGTIKLWQTADGKQLRTMKEHLSSVTSVAFSPDSRLLASGSYDNSVRLWWVTEGELLTTIVEHNEAVNCVAFSPDGQLLASGSDDKAVRVWRLSSENPLE